MPALKGKPAVFPEEGQPGPPQSSPLAACYLNPRVFFIKGDLLFHNKVPPRCPSGDIPSHPVKTSCSVQELWELPGSLAAHDRVTNMTFSMEEKKRMGKPQPVFLFSKAERGK